MQDSSVQQKKSAPSTADQFSVIKAIVATIFFVFFAIGLLVLMIPHQDSPDACENDKFNFGTKKRFCVTPYGECTTSVTSCAFNITDCVYGSERSFGSVRNFGYGQYCVNEKKAIYNQLPFYKKPWIYIIIYIIWLAKLWINLFKYCENYHQQKEKMEKINTEVDKKEL